MAPSFGRSISFPLIPAMSSKPRHFRFVNLPGATSSHPLHANLQAHVAANRSWLHHDTTASLPAGLAAIHALHVSLADILLHPESRRASNIAGDRLLDAFLLLTDVHHGFQECLLSLRHATVESRTALRRSDHARLASTTRSQSRAEKEISRLATSVSAAFSKSSLLNLLLTTGEEADMANALVEAASTRATASAALFSAAAFLSSAASSCKKTVVFIPVFARKSAIVETAEATVERLSELDLCFDECDGACDMVFRSAVQIRVSLLNIMTPTI